MNMSFGMVLVPLLFGALMLFFVLLFAGLAGFRKVERSATDTPREPSARPSGQWNGEILGNNVIGSLSGPLGSIFGVFEVGAGTMTFTPEGAFAPDWTSPCSAIVVGKGGFLSFNGAHVSIACPTGPGGWQAVSCKISRERIDRVVDGDFRDRRERAYADEFVACLHANGARITVQ